MHITRRYFLQSTGALALYCGINPLRTLADVGMTPADVKPVTRGKTFVAVFLRGGMDGLNFIVPFGDPGYRGLRPSLGLATPGTPNGVLDLDGFFGGPSERRRPHALLQKWHGHGLACGGLRFEYALPFRGAGHLGNRRRAGNTINSDGWLNRHLLTSEGHGPVRAISIGDVLPRILRGKAPAFALRGISDLTLPNTSNVDDTQMFAAIEHAYCTPPREHENAAQDLLAETAQTTLDGIKIIKQKMAEGYVSTVQYPKTDFANKLREIARVIKSDIGLEVAEIDYGGWDTHQNQGATTGQYAILVQNFAEGLRAFAQDLGDRLNDVLILTMSDFGRTAKENGTGGTDHGWANCMLAMGGNLVTASSGGIIKPVLSRWPGLEKNQLHEGRDLLHTTDFRDVLAEVVSTHLGNPQIKTVLPSHDFRPVGFLRG